MAACTNGARSLAGTVNPCFVEIGDPNSCYWVPHFDTDTRTLYGTKIWLTDSGNFVFAGAMISYILATTHLWYGRQHHNLMALAYVDVPFDWMCRLMLGFFIYIDSVLYI